MKEILIISGKGGTGKTTVCAAFAKMAESCVLADCDVDASDLHILVKPKKLRQEEFRGGHKARINLDECIACGECIQHCRFDAISDQFQVDQLACEGCGVCFHACPQSAISMEECLNGHWFISETEFGPMVHAALLPGEENSGKLVALVRGQAKELAKSGNKSLIIVDGAPGVGCPVISSITGTDHVLIVTEPTLSGMHDMKRVAELARSFNTEISVLINKYDLNDAVCSEIRGFCTNENIEIIGQVPYDPEVIRSMTRCEPLTSKGSAAGAAVQEAWEKFMRNLAA